MKKNLYFLLIFFCSYGLFGQNPGHFNLAAHYSPTIWQDCGCTYYGDYITCVNFDGDYVSINNLNNLGFPNKKYRLPAFVYYSVIETDSHYFITYALFHPADDFHCHLAHHENDLEGINMTIEKDDSKFGKLVLVQLQAHNDYYQYYPSNSENVSKRNEDTDGSIIIDYGSHPRVYVEGGGHGIRNEDTGNWASVKYYYKGVAEDPDEVGYSSVGYDLLSIYSELWERRESTDMFDNFGDYSGIRYSIDTIGRKFNGDEHTDLIQHKDAASTPWYWADNDDCNLNPLGLYINNNSINEILKELNLNHLITVEKFLGREIEKPQSWNNGDWFMDPALYQYWQFNWSKYYSINYLIHPFVHNQLPDEIYNGNNGESILKNIHHPYFIERTVKVLTGQKLIINPGTTLYIKSGSGIMSEGTTRLVGGNTPAVIKYKNKHDSGILNKGIITIKNNGVIKFGKI